VIYHLVWASDWDRLAGDDFYCAESLDAEGFIHCTKEPEKLLEVASLFFAQVRDEVLWRLTIDEARVSAEIKYEDPGVGHLFPHVYGPIELSAVVKQEAMRRNEDGRWQLP
jgi:uncharacterized protein (DUF952 family)